MSKNKAHPLSYLFVAGGSLLFFSCVLPMADSLTNWMQQYISNKISKLQFIMAQDQEEIEEIAERVNSPKQNAIGFNAEECDFED